MTFRSNFYGVERIFKFQETFSHGGNKYKIGDTKTGTEKVKLMGFFLFKLHVESLF